MRCAKFLPYLFIIFILFQNMPQTTYGDTSNFRNTILCLINVNHLATVSFFLHKNVNTNPHFFTFLCITLHLPIFFTPLPSPCFCSCWMDRTEKKTGLIIKEPMLLKWKSTRDVDSATALKTLGSAYSPKLFCQESYCTSEGHSSCPTKQLVLLRKKCSNNGKKIFFPNSLLFTWSAAFSTVNI